MSTHSACRVAVLVALLLVAHASAYVQPITDDNELGPDPPDGFVAKGAPVDEAKEKTIESAKPRVKSEVEAMAKADVWSDGHDGRSVTKRNRATVCLAKKHDNVICCTRLKGKMSKGGCDCHPDYKPVKAEVETHCCKAVMSNTLHPERVDPFQRGGPTPEGQYLIDVVRKHPKYKIPWYNLRMLNPVTKRYASWSDGNTFRGHISMHPGENSGGNVVVYVPKPSDKVIPEGEEVQNAEWWKGTCWEDLGKVIDPGEYSPDDLNPDEDKVNGILHVMP